MTYSPPPCLAALIKEMTDIDTALGEGSIDLGEALLRHTYANSRYWDCVKGAKHMSKYKKLFKRVAKT